MSPDPDTHPVRRAREAKGLRLEDLAKLVGKSASMLSNVEHFFLPKHATRVKIADALGTTPEALWPDEYPEAR